jgi:sigma-B regulation protein RsbU (phosphoserine phosphatase)
VFGGTLIELFDRDDQTLCSKLEGMLHRQEAVKRLQTEVSIAHRCHGGLQGEIARMHEELQLAAMVQREFLPRELPHLYGVEFAALWRPAHYVSGDIYDIARLDDDHVGVFIADAVGHGVPAALMTMVICRSLTTKIITGNAYQLIEPAEVLARLNRDMIRRQGRTTRFATAVYAIVNCRSREVRLAGAGHPPPLLLGADGSTRSIEPAGGLLGVFEDETYEQVSFDVAVGDRLLMYSDGFEQAFPKAQADAYERKLPNNRYREEFEQLAAAATPQEMVSTISRRLDDQTGSLHQLDDLTMICMRAGALLLPDEQQSDQSAATADRLHLA